MADVDAPLGQQVLHGPQGQRNGLVLFAIATMLGGPDYRLDKFGLTEPACLTQRGGW